MKTSIVLFFRRKSVVHQQDTMNEEHKIIGYKYIFNITKTVVCDQMQRPLFDPRVHYRVCKISSLYPAPSQLNPVPLQNTHHSVNPLNAELNPICHLLTLLGVHFLHVSRIRVKSLTLRLLMSYIYIWSTYC